jgi:hypothetical protein
MLGRYILQRYYSYDEFDSLLSLYMLLTIGYMDAANMIRSAGAFLKIIFKVNLWMTCRTTSTCSQFPSITICYVMQGKYNFI